jgi:hypothetical protein
LRFFIAFCTFLATLAFAFAARADKVCVLKITASGGQVTIEAQAVRKSVREAVVQRGHTLPTDAELEAAERAIVDGVPDSSVEYRAAGRACAAQWTIAGHVELREDLWRVELESFLVETGRVESLARDVDPAEATSSIAEMLALMIRPEGIGPDLPPWSGKKPVPKPKPKPVEPPPPPPPPPPPKPPEPPPPKYAEKAPFAVGAAGGVLVAAVRPGSAQGSATSGVIGGYAGYAIEQVPGLEPRLMIEGAIAGPRALTIDAGAKYAFPIVPRLRIYAGPELALGTFITTGADRGARFLARGAAFGAVGIGDHVQLEVTGDVLATPGGSGFLLLAGGGARALFRF